MAFTRFPWVPRIDADRRTLIFRLPLNQFLRRRVSLRVPAVFHPLPGDETKLGRDETIFGGGEDIRKPELRIS